MIELDYRESPKFMVIENLELLNSLNKWEGILYLLQRDNDDRIISTDISLIFKDKNSAQISYDLFIENINKHQTNEIIEIIFVEINDGYKVFITQDIKVLIKNALPLYLKPWVTPLCLNIIKPLTFIKKVKIVLFE